MFLPRLPAPLMLPCILGYSYILAVVRCVCSVVATLCNNKSLTLIIMNVSQLLLDECDNDRTY